MIGKGSITVRINRGLHYELKVRAARLKRQIKDLAEQYIKQGLKKDEVEK